MTHHLLSNPFHSKQDNVQERPQETRLRSVVSTRATPVCSHCRSDDIISKATAQWSNEKQEWELADTFARPAHCNTCNNPTEIVWLPLN